VVEELPLLGTPTPETVVQPITQPEATPTRVVSVLPVTGMTDNLYVVLAAILSIPMAMIIIGMIARRRGIRDEVSRL